MDTQRDLSLAYTPGVAVPVLEIADHPELAYENLEAQLGQLGLFELSESPEPQKPALKPLLEGGSWINQAVIEGTLGTIDLRTIAVIGLVGLAIQQALRGNIVGPALPLILSALDLAQHSSLTNTEQDS